MKRPLRPFLVEVKRTKRPGAPSSAMLVLPEDHAPASAGPTTPEQELIARIFSGVGTGDKASGRAARRTDESTAEDAALRGPRILESLAPVTPVVSEPELADAPLAEDEEDGPFGWLVHRSDTAGERPARRPRARAEVPAAEAGHPGFVVKPRRGRPPRSAASAPRVLDPSVWPEDFAPAASVRRDEPVAAVAPVVAAPEEPAAERPPARAKGRPRTRPVPAGAAAERPVVAAPVVETAPAAAASEADGRRRGTTRRRAGASELPAGQRWKKRLPKVLW